jgi:hypothetical protein
MLAGTLQAPGSFLPFGEAHALVSWLSSHQHVALGMPRHGVVVNI